MEPSENIEPDWDLPLSLQLTPAALIHTLFPSASTVHTGWESCIDPQLMLGETATEDPASGNRCRLVEQEFVEEGEEETLWHDWSVELRIGEIYVVGHWQLPANNPPMDWEWQASQAEQAFERACLLLGRRVRRGLVVEAPPPSAPPPPRGRTH